MANPSSKAERVRRHRERLREQGLRPVQIWVPDTRDPAFRERIRQASLAIANAPEEGEIMDFVEALQADLVENDPDLRE